MALSGVLADTFLMIGFGFMGFGEVGHRGEVPFLPRQSKRVYTVSTAWGWLLQQVEVVFVRVLQWKATLSPPLHTVLSERKSWSTAHTKGVGNYAPRPWGWT